MKIALVIPGGVDRSGEYRVIPALLGLIERLAARHELHVFALHQELRAAQWMLRGARVHNIGRRATILRGIETILTEHRRAPFSLVQSIFSGKSGVIATVAAAIARVPSTVHITSGDFVSLPEISYGGMLSWRGRTSSWLVLRTASLVSATSAPVQAEIAARGVSARRIPLGVAVNEWPALTARRRADGEVARLIHVASLNRVKDQTTLLHALRALEAQGVDYRMDIVGEDTLTGEIHRLASRLGLEARLTFHGFLPQRQLRPLMERAHVHVLSSRYEAGPFILLEAALVGLPTVATSVGHITEWAPQAAIGVPVGDAESLANGIARLLADEELRLRVATEAQRRALAQDADHTAAEFEKLYEDLLRR